MQVYKEITVRVPADFKPPEGMDVDYYEYRAKRETDLYRSFDSWRRADACGVDPWLVAVPKKPPLIPDDAYAISHPRCRVRVRNHRTEPWAYRELLLVDSIGQFVCRNPDTGDSWSWNECEVIED